MGAENDLQIVLNFCTDPIEIEIESEQKVSAIADRCQRPML